MAVGIEGVDCVRATANRNVTRVVEHLQHRHHTGTVTAETGCMPVYTKRANKFSPRHDGDVYSKTGMTGLGKTRGL